ncbi:MAG: histidinol-phosphatase [Verrucomicrobiota bacterium]
MSKTHPPKSKSAKKAVTAKPAAKKTAASKPTVKTSSKPVKKAPSAKPAAKAPAKKTVAKKQPAQKVAPAKKTAPSKAASAKKAVVKKAAPAKKSAPVKKAPVVKKAVAAKTAAPVKKAVKPVAKAPTKKAAPQAPATKLAVKVAAPAKKAEAKKPAPAPVKAAAAPVKEAPPPPVPVKAAPAPAPKPPAKPAASGKAGAKVVTPAVVADPIAPPKPPVMSDEKPVAVKSGALFYDSHMHTPLCKHAWGEPEEYAAQALKSGLKGIIFTCHCPMPDGFWPTVRMAESEFDTYVSMVQRTADAYKGKLDVCLGLESEFFPGYEKYIENLHKRADFDYILGAVHWQSKDYLAKFETGTIENFRRTYLEHLAQSAETGLYDCVAHPDLVKNYHPDSWCFAIIKNTVTTVLDRIAKTGVAMELNTSGLNKSYSEMNPGNEMLRMMADRKIPVVLGSDSHKAVRVGEHFITALNNLSDAGYEEVSYFKKRQRIDLKISDVLASIRKAIDANS